MKSFFALSFFCLVHSLLWGEFTDLDLKKVISSDKYPAPAKLESGTYTLHDTIVLDHPMIMQGQGSESTSGTTIVAPPNKPAFLITNGSVTIRDMYIEASGDSPEAKSSTGPLIKVQIDQALNDETEPTLVNMRLTYAETGVEALGACKIEGLYFFNSYYTEGATAIKVDDIKGGFLGIIACAFDNYPRNLQPYTACDITVSSGPALIHIQGVHEKSFSWSNDYCQNGIQIHVDPKNLGNANATPLDIEFIVGVEDVGEVEDLEGKGINNIQAKQHPIACFLPDEEGLKHFRRFFICENIYKPTYSFQTDAWIYFLDNNSQPLQTLLDPEQKASEHEEYFRIQTLDELFQQAPSVAKSSDGHYYQGEYHDNYYETKPTKKVIRLFNLSPKAH